MASEKPFQINWIKKLELLSGNAKLINAAALKVRLDEIGAGKLHGCYVFAYGGPRGKMKPIYVGKASRTSFRNECTTDRNLRMVEAALNQIRNQTAHLFLVQHPAQKGPLNSRCISEIEEYLIAQGHAVNPDLANVHMRPSRDWEIDGVTNTKKGRRSADTKKFASMLEL